jgi:hypothetical protein
MLSILVSALSLGNFLRRLEKKWDHFLIEHEILIRWYCKTNNLQLEDLPTRSRKELK